MKATTVFRCLIILSIVGNMGAMFYHGGVLASASQELREILELNGHADFFEDQAGSRFYDHLILGHNLVLCFGFLSQILMAFYLRFARAAYSLFCICFIAITPFLGLAVELPLENALYLLGWCSGGASLAMAYLPPINERFRPRA